MRHSVDCFVQYIKLILSISFLLMGYLRYTDRAVVVHATKRSETHFCSTRGGLLKFGII